MQTCDYFERKREELKNAPIVDVLLGTLNGEKYLSIFLESLLNQESVSVNLIVSDDGSVDQTLNILNEYKDKFQSFQLIAGRKKGAAQNYLSLLRLAQNDFVAFADQDDIWNSDHLINSIDRLKCGLDVPALSYSAMIETHENAKRPERIWPQEHEIKNLNSILIQNYARGCTIVLNRKAVNLINSVRPSQIVMHDWWVFQVIFTHGQLFFGRTPEIIYRIHSSNNIGIPTRWKSYRNFMRQLVTGKWGPFGQAQDLMNFYGETMNIASNKILKNFLASQLFSMRQVISLIAQRIYYKEGIVEEVSFRFALVLVPIATRNWK
jgi:glycosyltransferase involved in cell wall biosynthesis